MSSALFDLILLFCGYLGPGGYHPKPNYTCLTTVWECSLPAYTEGALEAQRTVGACLRGYYEWQEKKLERKVS